LLHGKRILSKPARMPGKGRERVSQCGGPDIPAREGGDYPNPPKRKMFVLAKRRGRSLATILRKKQKKRGDC